MIRETRKDWRSLGLVGAALVVCPDFAYGHGEQILVFPISLGLLIIPAIATIAIRWHRIWWARLIVAATLLGSNLALWFLPVLPRTIGELAAYDMRKAVAVLVVVPVVAAVAAGIAFSRALPRMAA